MVDLHNFPILTSTSRRMLITFSLILIAIPGCKKKLNHANQANALINPPIERFKLGSEFRNVSIEEMREDSKVLSSRHYLQVNNDGERTRMGSLEQLENLVNIRNDENALKIVRLKTSPALIQAWKPHPIELEVISKKDISTLPSFDVGEYSKVISNLADVNRPSGGMGVLSPEAFQSGEFTLPTVRANAKEFHIKRWILTEDVSGQLKIQYIEEVLTRSGKYKRTILINRLAPKLVGTTWSLSAPE